MKQTIANVAEVGLNYLAMAFYTITVPFALISIRLYQNSYCRKKYGQGLEIWYELPIEERTEATNGAIMHFYGGKLGGYLLKKTGRG